MKGEPDSCGGGAATGVRHHVTVMFSDLCSSTLLGHGGDPEVLASVLREVKAETARVVAQHDGFVNQFYGDGAMAIFGFPTPREDDVRRAAEAALELHRVVRNLSFDSLIPRFSARLHTGIHSGLVLVHEGARRERGSKRETAHGDQVRRG